MCAMGCQGAAAGDTGEAVSEGAQEVNIAAAVNEEPDVWMKLAKMRICIADIARKFQALKEAASEATIYAPHKKYHAARAAAL